MLKSLREETEGKFQIRLSLGIGVRKGIPKNLSSQVLGELRVNFWG